MLFVLLVALGSPLVGYVRPRTIIISTDFDASLAIPDMRVIPKKYHTYIERSIRRVYIPSDASYANTVNSLKAKVTRLESLVDALNRDKSNLMDRCEAHIAKSNTVGKREKAARDENQRLKTELDELKHKYGIVKGKYKTLKNAYVFLRAGDEESRYSNPCLSQ